MVNNGDVQLTLQRVVLNLHAHACVRVVARARMCICTRACTCIADSGAWVYVSPPPVDMVTIIACNGYNDTHTSYINTSRHNTTLLCAMPPQPVLYVAFTI